MPTLAPAETRTLIDNVRWETYVSLCDERKGIFPRMSYLDGMLELMSPRKEHEKVKSLLGRLIVADCEANDVEYEPVASTTFRRPDLRHGFEADESYYIQNMSEIWSKVEIDLSEDPPPDLVVEVELTSPLLAKLDLFATMAVPEVWRHDGRSLKAYRLVNGQYQQVSQSHALADFPLELAQALLNQRLEKTQSTIVKEFKAQLG